MKKLLSILASLGLAATASAGVVACGETPSAKVPSKNADVTIKSAAIESDGKTIDLTCDALVEAAKVSDFKVSKGSVASVEGAAGATTMKVVLKDALNKNDALTISAYKSTNVKVTMDAAPEPKPDAPTDNSKVTIKSGVAVDANTITLTTDKLIVDAKAGDFKLTGATIASVDGKKDSTTVTVKTKESLTNDMKVTVAGYATSTPVNVDMSKAPKPAPKDNSALSLKEAKLGDDLQTVTITVDGNLVAAVAAGDITISGGTTDGINGAVTDVNAAVGKNAISFKLAAAAVKGTDTTITVTIKGFKAGTATITVPAE